MDLFIKTVRNHFFTLDVSIKDEAGKSHGNFTAYKNIAALFMRLKGDVVRVVSQEKEVFYIDRKDIKAFLKATGVDHKGLTSENGAELVSKALNTFNKPAVSPRQRLNVGSLKESDAYNLHDKAKALGVDYKSRNIKTSLLEFKEALKSGALPENRVNYFQRIFSHNGTLDFIEKTLKYVDKSNPNFIFSIETNKLKDFQEMYKAMVLENPSDESSRKVLSNLLELERMIRDGSTDDQKRQFIKVCRENGTLNFLEANLNN